MWSWGANTFGTLGLNNTTGYSSPKQVGALTTWSKLSYGNNLLVLAIKTNGTLWAWGYGGTGALGLGNTTTYSSPNQVGALTTWSTASSNFMGNGFTVATQTDGTLWSWGRNDVGQLGLGNLTNYSSPKQVGALTGWSAALAGRNNSLAIKT
jgi:alpha-tubulin suppressor-like RCC1 family protein